MVATLVALLLAAAHEATPPEAISFRTGKDLEPALAGRIHWSSVGSELADQLRDLQKQSGVFILRDRRIDPHQLVSVHAEFVARSQVLRQISATIPDGGFCLTESLACVGTSATVHRLPMLLDLRTKEAESMRKKTGADSFRGLMTRIDASWANLSEPRQILRDHAMIAGTAITNPEAIPYDLWAAEQLPRMSFVELATVILNQFDLTFELAGDRPEMTVIPIDPNTRLEHRYVVGSRLKSAMTATWKQEVPDIEVHWAGPNATITTTLQTHAVLYALMQEEIGKTSVKDATTETPKPSIRTTNFQLSAERATVGQLIEFFRSQGIAIDVKNEDSPEVEILLEKIVDLDGHTERQPGHKLFPQVFGKYFKRVDVQDERVVLSGE